MSGCQGVGVLGCRGPGVSGCWGVEKITCSNKLEGADAGEQEKSIFPSPVEDCKIY